MIPSKNICSAPEPISTRCPPLIHTGIPRVMPAEADVREHVIVTFGEGVVAEQGTKMSRKQIILDKLKRNKFVSKTIFVLSLIT